MKVGLLNVQSVGNHLKSKVKSNLKSNLKSKVKSKVDWCSYEAAEFAVTKWHYSESMPSGKMTRIGLWEDDGSGLEFKGCCLFSRGANKHIGLPYKLNQYEVCELTRVALNDHNMPVTRFIKIAISFLKKASPGVRLIVSYADGNRGHIGKIYQAGNWYHEGTFANEQGIVLKGKLTHRRTINSRYGTSDIKWLKENIDPKAEVIKGKYKFKYLMPLDKGMAVLCRTLAKPYPKEVK